MEDDEVLLNMEDKEKLLKLAPKTRPRLASFVSGKLWLAFGIACTIATVIVITTRHEEACNDSLPYSVNSEWVLEGEFAPIYEWEGDTVVEPALLTVNNTLHMFYRARWHGGLIGHAFLANNTWHRDPFHMFAGAQPFAVYTDAVNIIYTKGGEVARAESVDLVHWNHSVLELPRPPGWAGWGNRAVLNGSGSRRGFLALYQEVKIKSAHGEVWDLFIYEHRDTYNLVGRMDLPRPHACGMIGGITFEVFPSFVKVWYHASLEKGNLPTAIFSAISTDMVTYHNLTCEVKTPFNHDQAADPIVAAGKLYYDVDDNTAERARIRWASRHLP